jgi:general secretion pathway protein M
VEAALTRVAYSADTEIGRVGTELQQRIRRIADEHDIRVAGTQILPLRDENGFVVVTVNGTIESEVDALGAFLFALADEQPPIIVEKLLVQTPRQQRRGEVNTRVHVQATMSVIRLLP